MDITWNTTTTALTTAFCAVALAGTLAAPALAADNPTGPAAGTVRHLSFGGSNLSGWDDDSSFWDPSAGQYAYFDLSGFPTLDLAPRGVAVLEADRCIGDEVRSELVLRASRPAKLPAGTVRLTATLKLFEGSSCATDDLEETKTFSVDIPPSQQRATYVSAVTHEVASDDWTSAAIYASNG